MGFRLWNLSTKPGMRGIPNFQNYLEGVATYVAPKGCYNNVREGTIVRTMRRSKMKCLIL